MKNLLQNNFDIEYLLKTFPESTAAIEILSLQETIHDLQAELRHDLDTGAYNRKKFFEDYPKLISKIVRYGAKYVLVYLDLDNFKEINDTLGHRHGDAVLESFVMRVKHYIRKTDRVYRVGGDEFVLIMRGDSMEHLNASIRCFRNVTRPFSYGVMLVDPVFNADEALELADLLMYEDKRKKKC